MRIAIAASASVLASCASIGEPPSCATQELLAVTTAIEPLALAPDLMSSARADALRAVSVHEPELGSDQYMYAAVVDHAAKQVWLYRYGGFAGHVDWYGPVRIPLERTAACNAAKGPIWLASGVTLLPPRKHTP